MVPDAAAKLLTSPAFDYKIYLCIFLSKSRENDLVPIGANLYTNRNKSVKTIFDAMPTNKRQVLKRIAVQKTLVTWRNMITC